MINVAVMNSKGGVGKTTLVDQLAFIFRDGGLEVQVIDLDPQQSSYFHQLWPEPEDPDVCIIDTRGTLDKKNSEIIDDASLVVIPTLLDRDSVDQIENIVKVCEKKGKSYLIVPNSVTLTQSLDQMKLEELKERYPHNISKVCIRRGTVVGQARDLKLSIQDVNARSNPALDFYVLADEIAEAVFSS